MAYPTSDARGCVVGGRRGNGRVWGKVGGGDRSFLISGRESDLPRRSGRVVGTISPLVVLVAAQCGIAPLPKVSIFNFYHVVEPLLPQFIS